MKNKIIKIGNSKGLRLPKSVIEECGFKEDVEMKIVNKKLIVSTSENPRKGWAEQFAKVKVTPDDDLMEDFKYIDSEIDEDWVWE